MDLYALAQQCAINTHPDTVMAVIRVESAGNPYAIGVNFGGKKLPPAKNAAQAGANARWLINNGYNIDMGLMQVNSANMKRFGLAPEQLFDPCVNIKIGSRILSANYSNAVDVHGHGQKALNAALSAYNTGNFSKGFRNGYVAKYYRGMAINRNVSFDWGLPQGIPDAYLNPYDAPITVEQALKEIEESKPPPKKVVIVEEENPYDSGSSVDFRKGK